jgi:hypothetical protein
VKLRDVDPSIRAALRNGGRIFVHKDANLHTHTHTLIDAVTAMVQNEWLCDEME